jgi:uncharacterized protein (TIGR02266 family)
LRLLTLAYPSAEAFLAAYDEGGNTLVAHTKTEAAVGEKLLIEVAFPGLPNRPLLRTTVKQTMDASGLALALDDADAETRDFLVKLARGELPAGATHREYKRFPTALPVRYPRGGAFHATHVDDLSAGGCFVRDDDPPQAGTFVALDITAPDDPTPLHLTGLVCWVRDGDPRGFGVEFDQLDTPDGRRLRTLLRRALGTGDVDL